MIYRPTSAYIGSSGGATEKGESAEWLCLVLIYVGSR